MEVIDKKTLHGPKEAFLSKRELNVLQGLIEGKQNKDIAKEYSLNEKTISTYKLRIITKLKIKDNCSSPLTIALYAIKRGYLYKDFFKDALEKIED